MSELTTDDKPKGEKKLTRAEKKLRAKQGKYMAAFLRERTIPNQVGQPEALNEKEGYYHAKWLRFLGFAINRNPKGGGFFYCTFPKGWYKKQFPGKDDWCHLVDNQGRARAAINYKVLTKIGDQISFAAFINYMPRFRAMVDHVVAYDILKRNTDVHYNSPMVGRIIDGETFIFETTPVEMQYKMGDDFYKQEEREIRSFLHAKCQEILDEHLPDNDKIDKYWGKRDDEYYHIDEFKTKLRSMNVEITKPKVRCVKGSD